MLRPRYFLALAVVLAGSMGAGPVRADAVRLSNGFVFELPRGWQTAMAQSPACGSTGPTDLPFRAERRDGTGAVIASIQVRTEPPLDARDPDLADRVLYERAMADAHGYLNILSWYGTTRATIGTTDVLVTEYRRRGGTGEAPFRVRVVRVPGAERTQAMVLEYRETRSRTIGPVAERLLDTLRIEQAPVRSAGPPCSF